MRIFLPSLRRWSRVNVGPDNWEENEKEMSEEIVRCPYCVLDSEFRPMRQQSTKKKYFVCDSCGHMATDDPYLKCPCLRCREVSRIALTRRRGSEDPQERGPLDLPLRP